MLRAGSLQSSPGGSVGTAAAASVMSRLDNGREECSLLELFPFPSSSFFFAFFFFFSFKSFGKKNQPQKS